MLEGHAHRHDAGADAAVIGHLITEHNAGCRIDDEPDKAFLAVNFDICLITDHGVAFFVRIGVHKGLNADGGSLTVVSDHLV